MQSQDMKAFKNVGRVIKGRIKKYQERHDDVSVQFCEVYWRILKTWEEVGFEKGYIKQSVTIEFTPDGKRLV